MSSKHYLKTWESYYSGLEDGTKTAEVRDMTDREFKPGDKLILEEYIPGQEMHTGRYQVRTIARVDDLRPFMDSKYPVLLSFESNFVQLRQENERLKQVAAAIEKAQGFASLEPNWSSYGSKQITGEAIAAAVDMLSFPQVVPTSIGGVQVEWHTKHFDYELEIGPDGKVVNEDEQENVRLQKQVVELRGALEQALSWLELRRVKDSDSFIHFGGQKVLFAELKAALAAADLEGKVLVNKAEWKPIETAPKNGKDFLAHCGEGFSLIRYIPEDGEQWGVFPMFQGSPFLYRWMTSTEFQAEFTHWQPLPEPPKQEALGEESK